MTRTPAPALTAEEARTLARFDAAQTPPEVVAAGELQETVARAMWSATHGSGVPWSHAEFRAEDDHYRRLAAAAIAADPSPAEEALRRVAALAEEFDSATLPPLINDFDRGLVAGYARAAARIRAALASPAPAPQDNTDQGSTAADSGALISDRRQGAARTVSPVVDHHSERSAPASQDGAR